MSDSKDGSDFGPLKFAPRSIIIQPPKDPLAKARKKFIEDVQHQSKIAAELNIKQAMDKPTSKERRKRMFEINGDGKLYIIKPKYGQREMVIRDDETIYADDLTQVSAALDFIANAAIRKEPWIDRVLLTVISRSKTIASSDTVSTNSSTIEPTNKETTETQEKSESEPEKKPQKLVPNHQRNRH